MDILATRRKEIILVSVLGIETRNGSTGRALRAALAVHLHADAGIGDAGLAGGVACTTGEFPSAVVRAPADALAEKEGVVAGTASLTGAIMRTL